MSSPNHSDDCTGTLWTYSGEGYNRVRLCACGAEDHDPDAIQYGAKLMATWALLEIGPRATTGGRGE